jgi:hypothetical protein
MPELFMRQSIEETSPGSDASTAVAVVATRE